jgi:hypothetical protein
MRARDACANLLDLPLFAIEKSYFAADVPDSKVNELAVTSAMSRLRNGLIAFGYPK